MEYIAIRDWRSKVEKEAGLAMGALNLLWTQLRLSLRDDGKLEHDL